MFLNKNYKTVVVFLLILLVQACSFEAKKNRSVSNIKSMEYVNSPDYPSINKVLVEEDDNIKEINSQGSKTKDSLSVSSLINDRVPIFILTGRPKSFTSIYGQYLCSFLNNDICNNKYIALTQPLKTPQDALGYLRKDDLTNNPQVPFVADFLITRTDYLFEKIKNNSGPLKDQPTLDVVMFLNGNYLFLWGNNKYGSIEFTDFVKKFNASNPNDTLIIAVTNNFAKELLTKIILANNFPTEIKFVSLWDINNLKNDNLTNYELIAYAGPVIHNDVIKTLQDYGKQFIPLTLADEIILNTQKANPEIATYDITNYYSKSDLVSIAMLVGKNNLKIKNKGNYTINTEIINDLNVKEPYCEDIDEEIPFVCTNKYPQDYDEKVFGKTKFNFNIKSIDEILEIEGKSVNMRNIRINSIGIRNVLLATRNTDINKVFDLACAFFSKYNLVKSSYITPDMRSFTIKDLLTGNLYKNNLKYHYGILNFGNYVKNNNFKIPNEKVDISFIISNNLTQVNYPDFYGLEIPTPQKSKIISDSYRNNIIRKRQQEVLRNLQIIINSIKKDLNVVYSNKDIVDSKSYDISQKVYNKDLYNTNNYLDLNIGENNFNDDYNYLPFSNYNAGK